MTMGRAAGFIVADAMVKELNGSGSLRAVKTNAGINIILWSFFIERVLGL